MFYNKYSVTVHKGEQTFKGQLQMSQLKIIIYFQPLFVGSMQNSIVCSYQIRNWYALLQSKEEGLVCSCQIKNWHVLVHSKERGIGCSSQIRN